MPDLQAMINDGSVWHLEGSMGRHAMDEIRAGRCTVGPEATFDYWGNRVPGISELEPGTMGTPEYCEKMAALE